MDLIFTWMGHTVDEWLKFKEIAETALAPEQIKAYDSKRSPFWHCPCSPDKPCCHLKCPNPKCVASWEKRGYYKPENIGNPVCVQKRSPDPFWEELEAWCNANPLPSNPTQYAFPGIRWDAAKGDYVASDAPKAPEPVITYEHRETGLGSYLILVNGVVEEAYADRNEFLRERTTFLRRYNTQRTL